MPFQPFGYRVEITSPLAPADFRAAVRSGWKGWFDPKNGARGWIVGPLICLWFSAFDQYGPMLFGLLSRHGDGTTLRGRAGSDLNGVAMYTLLIPLMAFLIYQMVMDGSASTGSLLVLALMLLVGAPLIYWSAHKERREAEPLIRFLRNAVTPAGRSLRSTSARVPIPQGLILTSGEESRESAATSTDIHQALLGSGPGDVVILSAAPESYIQTAWSDGGFILEKREGDRLHHFRATRRVSSTFPPVPVAVFTFEEALSAFMAYASGAPAPGFLKWEPLHLPA